ncbi:hypothetical protein LAZ67_22001866 [Cordylochernes scorpioides]|uniref:Uncharacterized protein n=1 Tax=Cordylochernes scorpioides TaxID=51811 RepID=A0ABY6LQA6_9ARAC|nr:hypothetical protein LAZ67_22001866 [Cordylochernes scorpioides]
MHLVEDYARPTPYSLSYDLRQDDQGVVSWRREEGDENGAKRGSYGYRDADGLYREVQYIADENGYRAWIKTNEPGTAGASPNHVLMTAEQTPDNVVQMYAQRQQQQQQQQMA